MTLDHLSKAVGITREMIERRDFLRRIYGDKFEQKIVQPKAILKNLSSKTGKPLVQTALHVCQRAHADGCEGITISWFIAALVELMEGGS